MKETKQSLSDLWLYKK